MSGMFGLPKGNLGSDVNYIISKSCGVVTNPTNPSYLDITNHEIVFPASGEYPVIIEFVPVSADLEAQLECVTGPQLIGGIRIQRNGVNIGTQYVRSNVSVDPNIRVATPIGSFRFIDFPSKGTHTYKAQLYNESNGSCFVQNAKMVVREDRSIRYKQL